MSVERSGNRREITTSYELWLRDSQLRGRVFLSSGERGAFVHTAKRVDGEHWFDWLRFTFDPRKKEPTYGRVDEAGVFEKRVMPRR